MSGPALGTDRVTGEEMMPLRMTPDQKLLALVALLILAIGPILMFDQPLILALALVVWLIAFWRTGR
jgi:hypothetical protein